MPPPLATVNALYPGRVRELYGKPVYFYQNWTTGSWLPAIHMDGKDFIVEDPYYCPNYPPQEVLRTLVRNNQTWVVMDFSYFKPPRMVQYIKRKNKAVPAGEHTFNAGSYLGDAMVLNNGGFLVCWFKHSKNEFGATLTFTYGSPAGNWSTLTCFVQTTSSADANESILVQASNGTIWCFHHMDGAHNLPAIRLHVEGDSITLDWQDDFYLNYVPSSPIFSDPAMVPEGEFPHFAAIPYQDGILLAFQNKNYKIFSPPGTYPFIKGAYISVLKIDESSKSLLWELQTYVERTSVFGLGIVDDVWLAYQPLFPPAGGSNLYYQKKSGLPLPIGRVNSNWLNYTTNKVISSTRNSPIVETVIP